MDAERDQFISFVTDQLRRWAPVSVRRLFGGQGIYRGERMFAFIRRDTLYLRTDDINRPDFMAAGMGPLRVGKPGKARIALSYHEAPAEILDEPEQLVQWAERAFAAALRRDEAKARRAPRARRAARNRTRRPPLKRRKD
ncbi:MAG TPA: TfoX/Sxy family protein [Stellaceae bacterium]|nr:TfoX/Sxy family protein [Stellaceae bacterium]